MESGTWRLLLSLIPLLLSLLFIVYSNYSSSKPTTSGCSLLPHDHYWIASKRIVTPHEIISGAEFLHGIRAVFLTASYLPLPHLRRPSGRRRRCSLSLSSVTKTSSSKVQAASSSSVSLIPNLTSPMLLQLHIIKLFLLSCN